MSGSVSTLERIKRSNEVQTSFLLSNKAEGTESSVGDNESWDSVYKPTTVAMKYESNPGFGRYVHSLKHLLPVRIKTGPGSYMPVDMTGCFAFTFFSWLTPLVWRTFRKGLALNDLYHCSPFDSCQVNGARFSTIWNREIKERGLQKASLYHALFCFMRTRYLICCFIYLLCVACGFIGPVIFMKLLLEYIQTPGEEEIMGITWMLGLLLCEIVRIMCYALMYAINIRTAIRASSAVKALLYKKITSVRCISNVSTGQLINLFSNDCRKVFMFVNSIPLVIGGPFVIVGALIYSWYLLGPFSFIGVAVFCIMYFLQFGLSYVSAKYRKKTAKITDERVSLMSEFLTNVKQIKLYSWEKFLMKNIQDERLKEKNLIQKFQYIHSISSCTASLTSTIATILTLLCYTLSGFDLTPAEAFTLVIINSIAGHGIRTLPMCVKDIVNGTVAISRLQILLRLEEKENYTVVPNRLDICVNMSKATLDWDPVVPFALNQCSKSANEEIHTSILESEKSIPDEIGPNTALVNTLQSETGLPPALTDVTFTLQRGNLVGICGTFGSGKSSLFAALLGQMRLLKGQVAVRGSVAYVPQQPWILNATLRENVLFGNLFSSKRYYESVYCCGLPDDIAALPGGDQTELGERGVTLSGGQKQRICLARAQYADKDLYLLDDPLSAVDTQVGLHIFQHCIKGALKEKSVLLITHELKYLSECDSVLFMKDGTIVDQGTHTDLINKDSEYAAFIQLHVKDNGSKEDIMNVYKLSADEPPEAIKRRSPSLSTTLSSKSEFDEPEVNDGHLTEDEKVLSGTISCHTYMGYIYAAGGLIICCLVLIWFLIHAASAAFSKYWLSHWLSRGDGNRTFRSTIDDDDVHQISSNFLPSISQNPDLEFYQLVYGLSVVAILIFSLILGYLFTKMSMRASKTLHDKLLQKVFHSPMHFFDTTPVGRILNMFTHDIDEVDTTLPSLMTSYLHRACAVIFALLLVVVVYHWFVIPLLLLGVLFIFLQKLFRLTMQDLKRFENVTRSPIFSHVAATVQGLPVIRAFQKQEDFFDRFTYLVDQHTSPQYLYYCSMRWLGTRMDVLGLFITLIATLFVIFLRDQVNPAFAALALVLVLQLSSMYQLVIRLGCDVETRFTSVERIQCYSEELEVEAPAIIEKTSPSPAWPTRGKISFIDVKMRYRPSLPLALKGLTFEIEHQEKIGIVGRTGSGKSSLGAALFRLVELSSGSIIIDGVNIKDLGLEDLRSRMSVIPQDPVLLRGTIRYNLDPQNEFEEEILWKVLAEADMKTKISSLEGGLDAPVVENGNNFSVGEKQLLCMARALLYESKIILLDEATASVDGETDRFIQNAIHQVFQNSTVLIIAHRLSTVARCDRVMVLSEGKIIEFDQPTLLLSNPNSLFSNLMSTRSTSIRM
ncbi:ATP-binding cassette sub-family C member 5-like [Uloborus diversus]|uniref:ATP-binding cassette sub-family C member 5-like n=1 Tax=Uloborus diversus TaxID=327109 RepID=UPI00240A96F4|nr:ATP-binding cassette sub-family C member 5-like [Uloborus diversus]